MLQNRYWEESCVTFPVMIVPLFLDNIQHFVQLSLPVLLIDQKLLFRRPRPVSYEILFLSYQILASLWFSVPTPDGAQASALHKVSVCARPFCSAHFSLPEQVWEVCACECERVQLQSCGPTLWFLLKLIKIFLWIKQWNLFICTWSFASLWIWNKRSWIRCH